MSKTGRRSNKFNLKADFYNFRDQGDGSRRVLEKLSGLESDRGRYLWPWMEISQEGDAVYPSQGLLRTPYDNLDIFSTQQLPTEKIIETLRLRMFFLMMFNHPYRLEFLEKVGEARFVAPPKVACPALESAFSSGLSLSVGDIGSSVVGAKNGRVSRTERYAQGPFVKLGRQARSVFVGSASPDVWNSSIAVSTMAACHCLAGIPRNGVLNNVKRQADLAADVFARLRILGEEVLVGRKDKKEVVNLWKRNVMGTLEGSADKALARADALYNVGVRSYRIYSPEPGLGPVETTAALRKKFGRSIEIFAGEIVGVDQAKACEDAGADGIFVGIGGGGRCITGVRSGSVVDWPELVWRLRGEVDIPVIVEGGASDHVAVTLLLGASGISVSRIVAGGAIESPGGALYFSDYKGRLFKPYGGEASARTKYLDGKLLPFDVPAFVEGETARAEISYIKHALPTLTYNLHLLTEDVILAMVFRGVNSVGELHAIDPSPLRQLTNQGMFQMGPH